MDQKKTHMSSQGHSIQAPVEQSLIEALAGFAGSLALDRVPERVIQEAKLCVLDTLGCILAGADSPEGAMILNAERKLCGDGPPVLRRPLSSSATARVFGYWGDIFELNDLIGGHAGIGNVTAALLVARHRNASGADLVRAVIAGIEITSRLLYSQTFQKKTFEETGIVSVSLFSSFGAGAAAALLCKLPEPKIANAIAVAGTIACWGPAEAIFGNGGTIKPILFGASPADSGIRAALYAEEGITGPLRLLEGKMGLLLALSHGYDPNVIRGDGTWFLLKPNRKLHASCGYTHSPIDAVVMLRYQDVDFAAARCIELKLSDLAISGVNKTQPPTTPNEARFHIQYCVALAASGVDVIVPEHSVHFETYLGRPEIVALMEKIVISPIEKSEMIPGDLTRHFGGQSIVRVTRADGQIKELGLTGARGSVNNPLSDEQIANKFRRLTQARFGSSAIESCIERTLALEHQQECGWIYELLDQALVQ